jgi:prolyl 4-hydroxylase
MARRFLSLLAVCLLQLPCGAFWSVKESEVDLTDGGDESQPHPPVPRLDYGVDVSFPIHHIKVSDNYATLKHNIDPDKHPTPSQFKDMVVQPLGNRQVFYDDFIQGCVKAFGAKGVRCTSTEVDRVEMSLRQPQSMQNYTAIGYKKIRAPEKLYSMIKTFWESNKHKAQNENWGVGNTYTNNWAVPSKMVSVEDGGLRGGGHVFKQQIWDASKDILSEWTGMELTQCSLYGIRVYYEGAVLSTHVDRLPLVSSAIINVAQDVDEPWPLEVYGHDGRAENVTMEPGDMVLYESHSVLHGRPFPLKGRFMANIFIHFEPTGHSLRHNMKLEDLGHGDVHEKYKDALARKVGGHENDNSGLPPYIVPGTPEEQSWRDRHPEGQKSKRNSSQTGSTAAHEAAKEGLIEELEAALKEKKELVNAKDINGWTPLHEGVRGGHIDVVKLLVEQGADVDMKTANGQGGTALWWAKRTLDDPIVEFLESIGALEAGPEL